MQILLNLVLQLFFIYFALLIGIPGTSGDNILKNKLVLYIGIVIFQLFIKSTMKIKFRCKFTTKNIIKESLFVGLLSVIGYSLYVDLSLMNYTRNIFNDLNSNKYLYPFIVSSIINIFILFIFLFQIIFNIQIDKCDKYKEIYDF